LLPTVHRSDPASPVPAQRAGARALVAALLTLLLPAVPSTGSAQTTHDVRTERVTLDRTSAGAIVQGQLQGREVVDYLVKGGAGQTLSVVMSASHAGAQFNVTPPESDQAMFIGSISGRRFDALLPVDGDYTLRVGLPRSAARRDEGAVFALHVGIQGHALAPVPASADALLRGTPFHASGTVPCSHYLKTAVTQCQAFVTRRVGEGNATVEVRWPDGARRRVLFLKGTAVASDAAEALSARHVGDACQLRVGDSERIEIPEALVRGG
jgi:hypothetical protein